MKTVNEMKTKQAALVGDSDHERGLEYEVKVLHIIGDRFGDFPFDTEFDVPLIEAYGVKVKRPEAVKNPL
jgi:hypothetical protein